MEEKVKKDTRNECKSQKRDAEKWERERRTRDNKREERKKYNYITFCRMF